MANKDKSKGKKEPTGSKKEKDQKVAELVLSLGVEGGGFSIYRTPLASGGWQFHEEGGSMVILDDDDGGMEEVWSHSTSKPVQTIQEMLPLNEEYDSWVMFCPISIHPEYRYVIWKLVQEIVRNLPDDKKRWWADRRRKRWERFLRRKVELEPSPTHATFVFVKRELMIATEGKSKGKEEENVSSEKKDRKPPEVVLELGVEGGGATIYRTQLASGGWQFHVEGDFMLLDEEIGSCSSTSEPFQTIQEAIRSLAEDGSWVFYYPNSIHPDYRKAVRCLVENTVRRFSDERSKPWKNHFRKMWWQKYRPEPRRRQIETDLFGDPIP